MFSFGTFQFEGELSQPVALDESLSGKRGNKRNKASSNRPKHTLLPCSLRTALSTKLDFDEFTDLESVGREGSYGSVSVGTWRGQDVAIKMLRVQRIDDAKVALAFEKEIVLMSKLKHKNVVQVHGVVLQPGKLR